MVGFPNVALQRGKPAIVQGFGGKLRPAICCT
jgi:hypothetical protein